MLMSDPHLESGVPNMFVVQELIWDGGFQIGGTIPGAFFIHFGRGKHLSWGPVSPNADASDLWQETLNDDKTQYFVDGEWRDLQIREEIIKVKGQSDIVLPVRKTHRGPLINEALMGGANQLYGHRLPRIGNQNEYSFGWGS